MLSRDVPSWLFSVQLSALRWVDCVLVFKVHACECSGLCVFGPVRVYARVLSSIYIYIYLQRLQTKHNQLDASEANDDE